MKCTHQPIHIGNRISTKAGGNASGGGLRNANYTRNFLNEYSQREVPAYLDVLGAAAVNATVTVEGAAAYRRGAYFWKETPLSNGSAPVWEQINVVAGTYQDNRYAFLPQNQEQFTYDLDGNMTQDGRWDYTWDAENRLVQVESRSDAPSLSRRKVVWEYDGKGRRIRQTTSDKSSGSYVVTDDTKFVYDGWQYVAELNHSDNALKRSYVWGTDLSGSTTDAGGVGGLLMMRDQSTINNQPSTHFYSYDGNGNVVALVKASDGSTSANYEYGPFGEVIRATGPMATENRFQFSTKRCDATTDFLLYEYRALRTDIGRWLNRDPLGDVAFMKGYIKGKPHSEVRDLTKESLMPPYQFARNNAVDRIDRFGLESEPDVSWGVAPCPRGQITAFVQVVVGYIWGDGGPHVDNGSLGPKSSTSTGCPLYPLPANMSGVFQDTPRGWTGDLQFIVCRVCLESCGCLNYTRAGRGGGRTVYSDYKIVGVGPCVYWKKGDKGDLSDKDKFTQVEGPNQNWQVGMDTDFPDASKGKCFTCSRPK